MASILLQYTFYSLHKMLAKASRIYFVLRIYTVAIVIEVTIATVSVVGQDSNGAMEWDNPLPRSPRQLVQANSVTNNSSAAQRYGVSSLPILYLSQNWTPADSLEFYSLRQGSPLINRQLFNALEQPNATNEPFRDPSFLASYGFLPQLRHIQNPDGYPIGFAGDVNIELNCSACHTSRLVFGGKEYRIDGGQSQIDVESWLQDLVFAMQQTLDDAPTLAELEALSPGEQLDLDQKTKFGRFTKRILGVDRAKVAKVYGVLALLERQYSRRQRYNDFNDFGKRFTTNAERAGAIRHEKYGPGRLDALGAILNQASADAIQLEENALAANAPVNYPAIWDAPHHKHVQWNGAVDNDSLFGPLGRNAGQVIGVFGLVEIRGDTLGGYNSSINFDALNRAESLITKLWSPMWPVEFGQDLTQLARGKQVYMTNCADCHALIKRDDPARRANDQLIPIDDLVGRYPKLNTDLLAAKNWSDRQALAGPLAGKYITNPLGERFPQDSTAKVFSRDILAHIIFGTIARSFVPWRDELTLEQSAQVNMLSSPSLFQTLMRYKARPLNGVWSTSPYLHNGSVLNMVELLKPPAERRKTFHIGTIEYDPSTLGFKDEGSFIFDTNKLGNGNSGHTYGTELPEVDKKALIEYLKTL